MMTYEETGRIETEEEKAHYAKKTGSRFRKARKLRHKTTLEAAIAVGIPAYYLFEIEEGMVFPPASVHICLADYYDLPITDLLFTFNTWLDENESTEKEPSKIIELARRRKLYENNMGKVR